LIDRSRPYDLGRISIAAVALTPGHLGPTTVGRRHREFGTGLRLIRMRRKDRHRDEAKTTKRSRSHEKGSDCFAEFVIGPAKAGPDESQ
jgi:hypothetical protein